MSIKYCDPEAFLKKGGYFYDYDYTSAHPSHLRHFRGDPAGLECDEVPLRVGVVLGMSAAVFPPGNVRRFQPQLAADRGSRTAVRTRLFAGMRTAGTPGILVISWLFRSWYYMQGDMRKRQGIASGDSLYGINRHPE